MRKIILSMMISLLPLVISAGEHVKEYQKGKLLDVITEGRSVYTGVISNQVGNWNYGTLGRRNERIFNYIVQVGEMVYAGEYVKKNIFQYNPASDFVVNDPVEVHIDGGKMYLKRPDGKELKTKIVKQMRADSRHKGK